MICEIFFTEILEIFCTHTVFNVPYIYHCFSEMKKSDFNENAKYVRL